MKFPYLALPTRRPAYPLGSTSIRHRPLLAIEVRGPSGARSLTATLDSGSDDTFLPAYLAPLLGIDLNQAPRGESGTVGGSPVAYHYATVSLRLSDGYEECEWDAIVGFVAAPMRWAILGKIGRRSQQPADDPRRHNPRRPMYRTSPLDGPSPPGARP